MGALATARRPLGGSGVEVSALGFGGAALGNLYSEVSDADAAATLHAAWESGARYFDTAPFYGYGYSEARIGAFFQESPKESFALSTKVGVLLEERDGRAEGENGFARVMAYSPRYDYGYDAALRSLEESAGRLGAARIDVALVHNLDLSAHGADTPAHFNVARAGAFAALARLKEEGALSAVGAGVNELEYAIRIVREIPVDCILLASRYTLLEQEALDVFLPLCSARGVSVIIGGPYSTGILATGAVEGAHYNYAPATPEILARVRRIENVCARHGVPLAAAALQFPLAHPRVASVIPGLRTPQEAHAAAALINHPIGGDFWADLKAEGLLRADAPTPGAP